MDDASLGGPLPHDGLPHESHAPDALATLMSDLEIGSEIDWIPQHLRLSAWFEHIPFAFWLVKVLRPQTLVELGTHYGTSYGAFCQAVDRLGLPTRCYAVDTWAGDPHAGTYDDDVYLDLKAVNDAQWGGFSSLLRCTFADARRHFEPGEIDLLHIDGFHTYDAVREDFSTWRDGLSRSGVVLFHDTNERHADFGVWRLWKELSAQHPHFEFVHGHGLGVLGLGPQLPAPLHALFDVPRDTQALATLRGLFAARGRAIRERYTLTDTAEKLLAEQEATRLSEQAVHKLQAEHDALGRRLQQLVGERDGLREELARAFQDSARLIAEQQSLRELPDATLQTQFGAAHARLGAAQMQLASSQGQLSETRAQLASTQSQLASSQGQLASTQGQLASTQGQLASTHDQLVSTHDHLASMQTREAVAAAQAAALIASSSWRITRPIRVVTRAVRRLSAPVGATPAAATMTSPALAPVFDPAAYLDANPDVAAAGVDPTQHWLEHGRTEGRSTRRPGSRVPAVSYQDWIGQHRLLPVDLDLQRRLVQELPLQPLVSIITPVHRIAADILDDTIQSVMAQTYGHWELCLAVTDGEEAGCLAMLQRWEAREPRIRIERLAENGGISRNSDAALAIARGEWAVLLDHDDLLTPDALFEMVSAMNGDPTVDFLYSDKDQVGADGITRQHPLLKPAWAPDIMLSANYLTHLNMMRVSRLRELGGWNPDTDGAQDWDLFLRVIGAAGRVRHVPKILYHWRQVPSSVAGGGAAAKPYAAEAQLRVIGEHLRRSGWPGAQPFFEEQFIRIRWNPQFRPKVSLLILANGPPAPPPSFNWPGEVEILAAPQAVSVGARTVEPPPTASGDDPGRLLNALAEAASGEILVVWDAGLDPTSPDWLAELIGPLANPDICAVAGAVLDAGGAVDAFGAFYADGEVSAGFEGLRPRTSGLAGSPSWYNNASAAPLRLAAMRRADWLRLGGCPPAAESGRPDLALTLRLGREAGRIFLNPYAAAVARLSDVFEETPVTGRIRDVMAASLPDGDPFVNPNLVVAETDWVTLRMPRDRPAVDHNFGAEARYAAHAYSADAGDVARSLEWCRAAPPGPLRRACWIVPDIEVPFYGGIHTILRAAHDMLAHHDVHPTFAVLGGRDPGVLRATIGRAFPRLAREASIEVLRDADQPLACGPVDAMFSTLWITAFPALRATQARRKFYFLQDWEPLFYPAGSISGLVEATYRFGFHAVCNTVSLAESYRAMGGQADHFVPSVDTGVFRPRHHPRPAGTPLRLFCYARPAAPRNCFETLTGALRDLKQKYGAGLDIVTAGGHWRPADHGLEGVVRHLGLLPYAQTGALYRACDLGLVAMATRHPSYLPFELMACGAAVVTNHNQYTDWLFHDGENAALCELTRGDVVRAIDHLIADQAARDRVVEGGYHTIRRDHADWAATCSRIHTIVDSVCQAVI